MPTGFWSSLPRPCFVLAPMSGVTDAAFRRIIAKYGKPDVTWTEFVSVDGLLSPGRFRLEPDLWFTEAERPVVAQIHGRRPENFRLIARQLKEMGFDGIDINMGCPAKEVERHGSGAALIKKPELAREVILACIDGAEGLPVSVKTRIGYRTNETETWLAGLLETGISALTVHARTRNEMSRVPARWQVVSQLVALSRELIPDPAARPLILGNGDVQSLAEAKARVDETGCDGVMIGRGIFGNPWFFNREVEREELPLRRVVEVMLEHTALFIELLSEYKQLEFMKKHYKAYVNGFEGAAELRKHLMEAADFEEICALAALVPEKRGRRSEAEDLQDAVALPDCV
ncbi:tRNA-dihydrouridine synthase [bacterium]|nr:tRNA-dihydrouridine synthase [bacterium]